MGSRIGYYPTPQAKFYAQQRANSLSPVVAKVNGPWGGYVPDLDPRLVDYRAAIELFGLVPDGEDLTYDYGWLKYEGSGGLLPLGVTNLNAAAVGATATVALPIVGLGKWVNQVGNDRNLAIACGTGSSTGLLYGFEDTTSGWVAIPPDATAVRISDTTEGIFDWCNYALAKGEGAGGGDPITGLFVFTNLNDDMLVYPYDNSLADYGRMPYSTGTIRAKSCCVWGERLFALNTVVNTGTPVTNPLELRWTEPSWSQVAGAIWTNVGAGALTLKEFTGAGSRILPLHDALAIYTTDGVAFAFRTGQATSPLQLEYVTKTRGLLGTRAVVDMGDGRHFGLFTDGWFFLDRNGQWEEAGTMQREGVTIRKWADTFYQSLDFSLKDKIAIEYDRLRGFIYIAWPDRNASTDNNSRNNRVWVFDERGNRVWPQEYNLGFTTNQTPLCWGIFTELSSAALTWTTASAVASPWTATAWARPWLVFTAPARTDRMVHGVINGRVLEHTPYTFLYDTVTPTWRFKIHTDPLGDHTQFKTLDRLWLEYVQQSLNVVWGVTAESGNGMSSAARAAVLGNSMPGKVANAVLSFRLTSPQPQFTMVGTHPTQIRAMTVQYLPTGTRNITPRGTP